MFYGKFLQDFKQDEDLDYSHVVQLKLPQALAQPLAKAQASALAALTESGFNLRSVDLDGAHLTVLRVKVPEAVTVGELQTLAQDFFAKHAQEGEVRGEFGPLKTFTQKKQNSFIFFEALKRDSLFHFAASLTHHVLAAHHPGLFPNQYSADQLEIYDNPELSKVSLVSAPLYIPLLKFRLSQDDEGRLIERLLRLETNDALGAVTFKPEIRVLTKAQHLADRKEEPRRGNRSDPADQDPDAGNSRGRGAPRGGRGARGGRGGRGGRR
jgi:hypothetical protein